LISRVGWPVVAVTATLANSPTILGRSTPNAIGNRGTFMPRRSIYVDEIAHQSPIPNASRIGNIIVSGLIRGADPATGRLADTLEQQCAFMFRHMREAVEAGGATVEDIIKVTVWMKELTRKPINDEWVKMFPDPASRPARQVMEVPMEPGVLIQCDFMAIIER